MKIQIKSNERIFVTGKTGCGKSVLVKKLLIPNMHSFVIYDYKNEINIPGAEIFHSISDFKEKPNRQEIIYRPTVANDEEFDALCRQVFLRGKNVLILDEVADHTTASKIVRHHDLIMRVGRSKGVGIVNCTQRPIGVHNNIISQCEHFFIFALNLEGERKKLAGFCGPKVLEKLPGDFWFWYYHTSMNEPVLCKPLKL